MKTNVILRITYIHCCSGIARIIRNKPKHSQPLSHHISSKITITIISSHPNAQLWYSLIPCIREIINARGSDRGLQSLTLSDFGGNLLTQEGVCLYSQLLIININFEIPLSSD